MNDSEKSGASCWKYDVRMYAGGWGGAARTGFSGCVPMPRVVAGGMEAFCGADARTIFRTAVCGLGFAVTVDMHLCATTMAVVPLHMVAVGRRSHKMADARCNRRKKRSRRCWRFSSYCGLFKCTLTGDVVNYTDDACVCECDEAVSARDRVVCAHTFACRRPTMTFHSKQMIVEFLHQPWCQSAQPKIAL